MPVVYTGMYKGERFNSISHLIGAALALAGSLVLVTSPAIDGDTRKILSLVSAITGPNGKSTH